MYYYRSPVLKSCQLLHSFVVDQLKSKPVNLLSSFNNKLLVSRKKSSKLFIYSQEGCYLSTITIDTNDKLHDAMWTPRGNIVYTTYSFKVVVILESGKVMNCTSLSKPSRLHISNDDIIYVADADNGVYQTTNEGVSWSLTFKSPIGWKCYEVIKITSEHSDDFWSKGIKDTKWQIYIHSVNREGVDGSVTQSAINLPEDQKIQLEGSRLSYDNNMNIFVSDKDNNAVHMFSKNNQYQVLLSDQIKHPYKVHVDKDSQLLYVGEHGVVKVFQLIYCEF